MTQNDLYNQRHIAYFDPGVRFAHVESVELTESDESISQTLVQYQQQTNVRIYSF